MLSVWNLTNRENSARFRIGEKLKEARLEPCFWSCFWVDIECRCLDWI